MCMCKKKCAKLLSTDKFIYLKDINFKIYFYFSFIIAISISKIQWKTAKVTKRPFASLLSNITIHIHIHLHFTL